MTLENIHCSNISSNFPLSHQTLDNHLVTSDDSRVENTCSDISNQHYIQTNLDDNIHFIPVGLSNPSNHCYVNSIILVLCRVFDFIGPVVC